MSADDHAAALAGAGTDLGVDVAAAARDLIAGLMLEPWGQVSPSVYETGRLVTLAPWLSGHRRRVQYLVTSQHADGAWGGPDGYALVPTLSATEAILATLLHPHNGATSGADFPDLIGAAHRGLRALFNWLSGPGRLSTLDMPAVELIVPALVASINQHLEGLRASPLSGLEPWRGGARLHLPAGMDEMRLAGIRSRLESGGHVPEKLLHAVEVAGGAVCGARAIRPVPPGTIGASPAATAAWLGDRGRLDPGDPARQYLESVVRRHAGPVPCATPITVFERAWVLSVLARAGVALTLPPPLLAGLETALGPTGTPAGAGLPPDADTTSVVLYTLALLGSPREPCSLWAYEAQTHFCTWPGEQGFSVSVNAHVLDAFGQHLLGRPHAASRYAATLGKLSAWLSEHQQADGSWLDRWHASPYYATLCCALALNDFGSEGSATAVRKAVRWVLATQRSDGSWGRWGGTAEETAYAMQILLLTRPTPDELPERASARGYAYLLRSTATADYPSLWHDKDLYLPAAIVRAAVLAALHLAQLRPAVVANFSTAFAQRTLSVVDSAGLE